MRIVLLSSAIALAACATDDGVTTAADRPAMAPADAMSSEMPTDARSYVRMAGASDLYEIESSRLALERSQDASVRQFAQMMIDQHTQTTQTIMQAARAARMTPAPPQLMPMQQEMIAELRTLSGADFDRAYTSQQRRAHEMALSLHSRYAEGGDTAELRNAAKTAVPIIRTHIQRLQQMPLG